MTPAEVELRVPKTSFEVSVSDGETVTRVERQGHGFQRTLLISALQVLAESTALATEGVFCLAIEEPELFQHPVQAQAFAKVLRSLAESSDKRMQVCYATHSPYFIESKHFDQVRRLTRTSDAYPTVSVHSSSVAEVKARLAGIVDPYTIDRQLDGVTTGDLSIALFSNRAFIVEGTTEKAVFYGLADRVSIGSLESAGTTIVSACGKSSIPLIHAILSSIGIPVYALFDGDAGFEARSLATGKSAKKISDDKTNHITSNRRLLKYFGLVEVDFPDRQVTERVAVFDDNLEAFFAVEWPEWTEACNHLEASTGISLGKNQLVYRKVTLETPGTVPTMLSQILAKVQEVQI